MFTPWPLYLGERTAVACCTLRLVFGVGGTVLISIISCCVWNIWCFCTIYWGKCWIIILQYTTGWSSLQQCVWTYVIDMTQCPR